MVTFDPVISDPFLRWHRDALVALVLSTLRMTLMNFRVRESRSRNVNCGAAAGSAHCVVCPTMANAEGRAFLP